MNNNKFKERFEQASAFLIIAFSSFQNAFEGGLRG